MQCRRRSTHGGHGRWYRRQRVEIRRHCMVNSLHLPCIHGPVTCSQQQAPRLLEPLQRPPGTAWPLRWLLQAATLVARLGSPV